MATPTVVPKTAYDLTVGVVVNMDEAIYLISPDDSPLITGMGADGLSVISSQPVDEIVFSWMHDTLLLPRSAVTGGAITTGDTIVTVTSGDRSKFSTGDVLRINKVGNVDEIIRISGYGTTTDTLLITRAYSGTATNYASGAIIVGLGTALPEGDDPESPRTVDRTETSNVTQIFGPTSIALSRTEQRVRKYGVANEFAHQVNGRMVENVISREQAYLYGRKFNSTTAKVRMTGGLMNFLQTNLDTSTTAANATNLQASLQTCYNLGGVPDRYMSNPVGFADLNDIGNTGIVRVTIDDPRRGRIRAAMIDTEFGSLSLVRNRWMLPGNGIGFRRDNVIRRVLSPLVMERLAKTGDSDKVQIVCEEGLEVKGEKHAFAYANLAYTGSV